METILELVCNRTATAVDNTVLVANDHSATVSERLGSVDVIRLAAVAKMGFDLSVSRGMSGAAEIGVVAERRPVWRKRERRIGAAGLKRRRFFSILSS